MFEPVEQVLAEVAAREGGAQIAVRRRDDPHVHGRRIVRAEPEHLPLLQDAQEPRLERGGDVADLVEEDRAGVRRLEEPRPAAAARAGEGALLVPEELGLEQRLGERGAVHRHERPVAAAARAVDALGDHLLAGAALAGDEHGRVGARVALRERAHPRHGAASRRRGPRGRSGRRSGEGGARSGARARAAGSSRPPGRSSTAPRCTPPSRSGTRLTTTVRFAEPLHEVELRRPGLEHARRATAPARRPRAAARSARGR